MGQKINPIGLRLGINRTWDSRWFAGKSEYGKLLHEDVKIRAILHKDLKQAAVARIVIERPHKKCRVTIHSARPGVVIGKKGADIDKLRKRVADITASDVVINIVEIRKPELDATLVAESIAQQLADFDILVQQLAVLVLAGEPTGIPRPVDAETQSDRIDLLTHRILLRSA